MRIGLDPEYREEDWGFTAQQVVVKRLKAWIVLSDRRPLRVHELTDRASLAGQPLGSRLAALLALLEAELERCESAVGVLG